MYHLKKVFEYNQCIETHVNKHLGIVKPPDPEKPKEIVNDPEPTHCSSSYIKTADELYNELKRVVYVNLMLVKKTYMMLIFGMLGPKRLKNVG